ncbi:MAG: glycosyltransferase family 2 protein [Prevotellaceae bacterium]|jgi:glycosyltransferase involved in cell wall biosynthesis|nr:glycosyltransferase family 2 protein [Prevotellaceae bacterium]
MISTIILTYNEELHIERCIRNAQKFSKEIFVVDSFSTDRTVEIAEYLGAKVSQNKWENNYARQFNWALDSLPVKTEWVFRLDADEYLTDALIEEIKEKLPTLDKNISGVAVNLGYIFLGKWIKRGIYPLKLLRLFKYEKARCEERWMDEHIELLSGQTVEFKNSMFDHNLNNLGWFTQKHNAYSIREAIDLLDIKLGIQNRNSNAKLSPEAQKKRKKKLKYAMMPLFLRAFLFFAYRYIYKLGFIEGKEAFIRHFLQGLWYRILVDAKIFEIQLACGNDREKIIDYIRANYGIDCSNPKS